MYEIIRTDRTNGDRVQVAHDIPTQAEAEELRDKMRETCLQWIEHGSIQRYGYRVYERAAILPLARELGAAVRNLDELLAYEPMGHKWSDENGARAR